MVQMWCRAGAEQVQQAGAAEHVWQAGAGVVQVQRWRCGDAVAEVVQSRCDAEVLMCGYRGADRVDVDGTV